MIHTTSKSVDTEGIMAEINDRACRAANVMVYGLPESTSPDVNTRRQADLQLTTRLSLLKISQPNFDNSGVKTFRVGKNQGKNPRPLKVILINEHDAQLVLSNFSHDTATEANQSFSQFKVARDKTPQEQKYLRVLIAEIEERKSKGENDLKIKFKNNIPSIVKMSKTD